MSWLGTIRRLAGRARVVRSGVPRPGVRSHRACRAQHRGENQWKGGERPGHGRSQPPDRGAELGRHGINVFLSQRSVLAPAVGGCGWNAGPNTCGTSAIRSLQDLPLSGIPCEYTPQEGREVDRSRRRSPAPGGPWPSVWGALTGHPSLDGRFVCSRHERGNDLRAPGSVRAAGRSDRPGETSAAATSPPGTWPSPSALRRRGTSWA